MGNISGRLKQKSVRILYIQTKAACVVAAAVREVVGCCVRQPEGCTSEPSFPCGGSVEGCPLAPEQKRAPKVTCHGGSCVCIFKAQGCTEASRAFCIRVIGLNQVCASH